MAIDKEILEDFTTESKDLVDQLIELLEETDGEPSLSANLDKYGQIVDRIMGGSKSLAQTFAADLPSVHLINQLGDYAAVCKSVGYKASQIKGNDQLFNICVAFLLDATEMLDKLIAMVKEDKNAKMSELLNQTFLDRLNWINAQFKGDVRSTVASSAVGSSAKSTQIEIDELLKKLGVG